MPWTNNSRLCWLLCSLHYCFILTYFICFQAHSLFCCAYSLCSSWVSKHKNRWIKLGIIEKSTNRNDILYRKSAYFCYRLIFSDFAGEQDSQKYFPKNKSILKN